MSKKKSKVSVLKEKYHNFPEKDSISLREYIEIESLNPEFWNWFFDYEVNLPLTEEQQNYFYQFLNMVDRLAKRKPKIKTKDTDFHIKLSSIEKEYLKNKANKLGITLSSYIRNVALENQIIVKTDFEMVRQVRKIGININQIAHKINQEPTPKNINVGLSSLKNYMEMLKIVLKKIEA